MYTLFESFLDELTKIAYADNTEAIEKAELIKKHLQKNYGIRPYLSGSLALGTNIPGKYDYDFGVTANSIKHFDNFAKKLESGLKPSPFNKKDSDYKVFQGKILGEPVDVALILGDKGKQRKQAIEHVSKTLSEDERKHIVDEKKRLQNAWFFKDLRYKRFKKETDEQLGIPRFKREPILQKEAELPPPGELNRSDIYGHRTRHLESVINNGLMSASLLHRKGLLKDYEDSKAGNLRDRTTEIEDPEKLKSEVFVTKGLMPSSATYGRYGVLFRSRKAKPSKYLNTIPTEHVIPEQSLAKKMTFVVPDDELEYWESKYPNKYIVSEASVPKELIVPEKDYVTLLKRITLQPSRLL